MGHSIASIVSPAKHSLPGSRAPSIISFRWTICFDWTLLCFCSGTRCRDGHSPCFNEEASIASCNSFHLYSFLRSSLLVDAWQGFRMSLRSPLIHRLRCSAGRRCRRRHNESELCEKGFNKEGSFHCCCEKKHFDFGLGGLAFEALLSRGVFPLFP